MSGNSSQPKGSAIKQAHESNDPFDPAHVMGMGGNRRGALKATESFEDSALMFLQKELDGTHQKTAGFGLGGDAG